MYVPVTNPVSDLDESGLVTTMSAMFQVVLPSDLHASGGLDDRDLPPDVAGEPGVHGHGPTGAEGVVEGEGLVEGRADAGAEDAAELHRRRHRVSGVDVGLIVVTGRERDGARLVVATRLRVSTDEQLRLGGREVAARCEGPVAELFVLLQYWATRVLASGSVASMLAVIGVEFSTSHAPLLT